MKLKKNIATSEAGLIFNPCSGDSFSVNKTGTEILTLLKENKSMQDILDTISSGYDVEKIQLEKDIDDFLLLLSDYNLLDK